AGLSQAEAAAPLGNAVNPQPLRQLIKIDVARFHQGSMEIDLAVAALFPAFELVVAADQGPGAIKGGFGGDDLLFQAGHRHDNFESGTWGILSPESAVFQEMALILAEPLPFLGRQPPLKGLLGKGWGRGHGENLAGTGVKGDDGSRLAFQA